MDACVDSHSCFSLVQNITSFKRLGGRSIWIYILCEANKVADELVRFNHSLEGHIRV